MAVRMSLFHVLGERPVDPQHAAARFIDDPKHEETHDRLVWAMRTNRDKAVAALPEWE